MTISTVMPYHCSTCITFTFGSIRQLYKFISVLNLADWIYVVRSQYHKYRPHQLEFEENRGRALLKFASTAILDEIRERRRQWTWAYFAERRDDRHRYVELFKKKQLGPLVPEVRGVISADRTDGVLRPYLGRVNVGSPG